MSATLCLTIQIRVVRMNHLYDLRNVCCMPMITIYHDLVIDNAISSREMHHFSDVLICLHVAMDCW